MSAPSLSLGALGGPHTFNGLAAQRLKALYPVFAEIRYFPSSDAVVEAALAGEVDAACAPEQMSKTGFHAGMLARMTAPDSKLYVIAEAARAYGCALLGKPGASLNRIRLVTGHDGSITQSRAWLAANLPAARIEIVDTHSEVAACAVLESDGSVASVGSRDLAASFGLAEMARDIDGGGAVNYWALSLKPLFSETPDRLLVTGRFRDDSALGALVAALGQAGWPLRTACPQPIGRALYEFDYMLRFAGTGSLATARESLARFPTARLAGAWDVRD